MIVYLPPGKMIIVLIFFFLHWLRDYALLMPWLDHILSIKKDHGFSDLKLCFALLLLIEICYVMIFLPSMSMFRISIIAHQMNWFCFCCFCEHFFHGPKLLDVMFVLLPGEKS